LVIGFLLQSSVSFSQEKTIDKAWNDYSVSPSTSKKILTTQLKHSQKRKSKKNEAKCLSYLGVISDIEGDSKKAIELLLQAIRIQEKNNFEADLSFSYNNLGIAHFYQNNYKTALFYYKKSLAIDEKRKDKKGAVGTLVNIGLIYTYQKKSSSAKTNYNKALKIYQEFNDSAGISTVYNNLAKIEFEHKNYQSAIDLYKKTEIILPSSATIEVVFTTYYGMANSSIQLKKYPEAIAFAEKSIELAKRQNAKERLQYGYEILAEALEKNGNHSEAYQTLQKYTQLRDQIVNESNSASIAEMQEKYDSEKKDKKLLKTKALQLQKDNEISSFEIKLTIAGAFLLLFVAITIFLGYRSSSNKKNADLLKQRNLLVQENLKQKELMIGEIHHRVKNNLQLISSIIDLHARTLENSKEKEVLNDSRKRVESISLVHQKLYQNDEIYSVDLKDYFEELGRAILLPISNTSHPNSSSLKFEVICSTELLVHLDSAIPLGLIVSELITNSMKYAFTDQTSPEIIIRLDKNHKELHLSYSDNGNNFSTDRWENSTSFGKKMIQSLLRQLKGEAIFTEERGMKAELKCINIIWN